MEQGERETGRDIVFRLKRSPPGPNSPAPGRLLLIVIHSKVCALKRSREGRELGRRGEEGAPEGAGAPGE